VVRLQLFLSELTLGLTSAMENFARCYVDPFIEFVDFHLVFIAVVPSRLPFVLFTV
jgi:hypothetical protein